MLHICTDIFVSVFTRQSPKPKMVEKIYRKMVGDVLYLPCNHTISSPSAHYHWTTVICPSDLRARGCKKEHPTYLPLADMSDGRISMFEDGRLTKLMVSNNRWCYVGGKNDYNVFRQLVFHFHFTCIK